MIINIKQIALFLCAFSMSHLVYAGSSDAVIECKSGSGRTTLQFFDQDIQGQFQGGTLSVDKARINYLPLYDAETGDNNPYSWMTVNMKEGVYTLVYQDSKHVLNFYALPSSVEKKTKEGVDTYYKFNGVIAARSSDPRNNSLLSKKIWVGCTMRYSI